MMYTVTAVGCLGGLIYHVHLRSRFRKTDESVLDGNWFNDLRVARDVCADLNGNPRTEV